MIDIVKLTPDDKRDWLKTHTLTSEQRRKIIASKLERATAQFKTDVKTKVNT